MDSREWEKWRSYWHNENLSSEEGKRKWKIAQSLGLESSICSVEGCLRDAIGFMWADDLTIDIFGFDISKIDKKSKLHRYLPRHLKYEMGKCIFHTDKENDIWIENWNGDMEKWKKKRDNILRKIRDQLIKIEMGGKISTSKGIFDTELRVSMQKEDIIKSLIELSEVSITEKYNWNNKRKGKFWQLIRMYKNEQFSPIGNRYGITKVNKKGENIYDFSYFVFPEFEHYTTNLNRHINFARHNGHLLTRRDFSFWMTGEKYSFVRKTSFMRAIFVSDANFDEVVFDDSADFSETTFMRNVDFSLSNFIKQSLFVNVVFLRSANFVRTQFFDKIYFDLSKFVSNIIFLNAIFNSDVRFKYTIFIKGVNFKEVVFKRNSDFGETSFNGNTDFRKAQFIGKSNFWGATFGYVDFWETKFYKIANFNKSKVGEINLAYTDFRENSKIIFRNIKISNLTILGINHRLTPDNFLIHNLDISDPDGTIHFESVYLEDLKFVNVNWGEVSPKRISRELYEKDPRAARDIYRQIKLALDKQENYIDARKFYALELQAHGRELEMEIRDSSFPIISWIFGKIIDVSGRLLYSQDTLRTIYLQITATLLRLLGVSLYLIPVLFIFLLLSYHTSLAPIIFLLLLFFIAVPHYRFPFLRTISALNSLVIYYLYGLTANFGLSWLRPLMWLIGTVSAYTYVKNRVDKWGEFVRWILPEKFAQIIFKISKNLNQFASNFLQFLPNQNLYDKKDHSFLTLIFFILSSYLIYQTIVALRRRVRR